MTPLRTAVLAVALALSPPGAALADDPAPPPSAPYLQRTEARFGDFAGSSANMSSLVTGLRSGTPITLQGSGETVVVDTPTRPMGYGNITRSLDLANRQLAAQGITQPTPSEIQAALTGGTVNGVNGPTTLQGVLTLRDSGMGWGQIAHTVGVFPGMGAPAQARFATALPGSSSSGITTAAGTPAVGIGAQGKGLGNAGGGSSAAGIARGGGGPSAAGVTTAAGGNASNAGNASGRGQGNAFGRAGR